MATRPKAVIESRNGEKFSPITIAKNVLTDDGQNLHDILSDRKEDMMTPTIENSSSMFKVGQGDNVDFSDNVMNGAYEDVVLKGRSLVNIAQPSLRAWTMNSTSDTASLKATTEEFIIDWSKGVPYNAWIQAKNDNAPVFGGMIKPNTEYTFIINILENNPTFEGSKVTSDVARFQIWGLKTHHSESNHLQGGITGRVAFKYSFNRVTEGTIENMFGIAVSGAFHDGTKTIDGGKLRISKDIIILEGDYTENYQEIPYFEGLCDSKSPILSNVGKNLFDYKNYGKQDINIVEIENGLRVSTWATSLPFINNLLPNTKYTSKSVVKVVEEQVGATDIGAGKIYIYNGTNYFLLFNADGGKYVFTTPSDIKSYNRILFYAHGGGGSKVGVVDITNIQLEETSSATTYEPYKSNTTTFEQKDGKTIVLRSLPNGVCDTLNVETGEYVQNIGEVVLDGSEDGWGVSIGNPNTNYPTFTNNSIMQDVVNINSGNYRTLKPLCNKYSSYSQAQLFNVADSPTPVIKGIAYRWDGYGLGVRDDDRFNYDSEGLELFKQSLAQNPITVQYELATPIVKQINVEGYPYAYENGHVLLESGSQEQSLTPTIEYSIVANRGGQIRSNQRMIERHQKQLDRLQAMILTNLINTQYEQTLTNLKYDLKNVREEVK